MHLSKCISINISAIGLLTTSWLWAFSAIANESEITHPQYVQTITNPYEQNNDIHPSWSRDGEIISFERYDSEKHEIILTDKQGVQLQTISISANKEFNLDDILGESDNGVSFNSGISWAPKGDKFVFTSNGKFNNFDLYTGKLGVSQSKRITYHHQKDSHANWSYDGRYIAFISSRSGWAQLYRFDTQTGEILNLLDNKYNSFYPIWSPDSKKLAFMQEIDDVFQIFVIDDIEKPSASLRALTKLSDINLRPSWSEDGRQIAFFHYNKASELNPIWDIVMLQSNRETPLLDKDIDKHTIANNVIINSETGPTWIPNSNHIAYVKNINEKYNPIYLVNLKTNKHTLFRTNTNLNKDLACSKDGILAFQSQDKQWSRIFISKLPDFKG